MTNKQKADRARELIHEYKLLETQAQVYLSNNNMDKYIKCLDLMSKTEIAFRKLQRKWKIKRLKIIVSLN